MKTKLLVILLFIANTISAKTIKVSLQKGATSREKLENAYKIAQIGDEILLDINVLIEGKPFKIVKDNVSLVGAKKRNKKKKYKIYRTQQKSVTVNILTSNITIANIQIESGVQGLVIGSKKGGMLKNIRIYNCYIKNTQYTGINFYGNHENITIDHCKFYNCKFSLQTLDSRVLKNFKVSNCEFHEGDHQLSLDNPHAKKPKHSNIVIEDCKFFVAKRFNIALANTQNVSITGCYFEGGLNRYSQALHFEDRSENIYVANNTIKNANDCAVLSYATDKVGHGEGPKLTEKQKRASGCKNITLKNNIISGGGSEDAAISITYGRGFFKLEGDNKITSKQPGIKSNKSDKLTLEINDDVIINGKKYGDISKLSKSKQEASFLTIR